jgi:hypothetical protein
MDEDLERDAADLWDATVASFEQRLGNVRLADLERGDENSIRIATRSLRKEFMRLMTADAEDRSRKK